MTAVVVDALLCLAGMLAVRLLFGPSPAEAQTGPRLPPGAVVAVPGQITKESFGLYLVDLRNGTICVYQYVTREKSLRLLAARTFVYDLQLDSYNTTPLPKDVQKMVTEARRLKDVKPKP